MNISGWKKEVNEILDKGNFEFEKFPAAVRRCPKCSSLSLEFDPETGRMRCSKCGFEEFFKMIR